jgi:uncharacterized membrane protein
MSFTDESKLVIRNRFISGLLVTIPLILTIVVLRAMVEAVDSWVRPLVIRLLGHSYDFPFIGIIITFILIILAGIFTANVIGKKLLRLWEFLLLQIPLVNFVYGSTKQFVQALTLPQKKIFKSVVLVEYPRKGVYAVGLLANQTNIERQGVVKSYLCVFIPSTPTPFTGIPILFPEDEVIYLDMPIEDGIKLSVSGGIITPKNMRQSKGVIDTRNDLSEFTSNEKESSP